MKAQVRDPAALKALKPLEMAAYLRAKGWRKEADFEGKGSLWLQTIAGGEEFDVTLPLKRDLADYALRMSELLRTLALVENRSELEVMARRADDDRRSRSREGTRLFVGEWHFAA